MGSKSGSAGKYLPAASALRFPVFFAVLLYFVGFSALAPFYLSQYIYRTMNETVEQAAFMAQLGNLQEAPSARPPGETHALPLSGILLSAPEGETRLIWLVSETAPQPIV